MRARGEGVVLSPRVSLHCHGSQLGQGDLERYDSVDLKIRKEHRTATKSKSYLGLKVANDSSNDILFDSPSILQGSFTFVPGRKTPMQEQTPRRDKSRHSFPSFWLPFYGSIHQKCMDFQKSTKKISCPRRVFVCTLPLECEPSLFNQQSLPLHYYCIFLCSAFWILLV